MDVISFRITFKIPALEKFFLRFENYFNAIYRKKQIPTYIEVIQNGFLWFFKDLDTFSKIFSLPSGDFIQQFNGEIKFQDDLLEEIADKYPFQTSKLILHIQSFDVSVSLFFGQVSGFFNAIHPQIHLSIISDRRFNIEFLNKEAFITYMNFVTRTIEKMAHVKGMTTKLESV
jgi:hypothetical protein